MWTYGPRKVFGALASKSNSRTPTRTGRWIKSKAALEFVDAFKIQVKPPREAFAGLVELRVVVHYPDWRRDLDIELLKDVIQAQGIIKNDRSVVKVVAVRGVNDKANPRLIFSLREIADTEIAAVT